MPTYCSDTIHNHNHVYGCNFLYNIHLFFQKKIKRDHDEHLEDSLVDRLQTPIIALIQQSSADRIYSQLQGGRDPSPEGELAKNTLSPANQTMEQQPKRLFSVKTQKSDFWSRKLAGGMVNTSLTVAQEPEDPATQMQNTFIQPRLTEIPAATTWERIEIMLTETDEPNILSTVYTLKKLQEDRAGNTCSDPISGKELKTNTRRSFFLNECEKHIKVRALEAGSTVAGLPYSRMKKTVTQVIITDQGVRLKVNKNISSQAEHSLYLQLAKCKNQENKDKIYSILLQLHSIGINCLRP